MNRVNSLLKSNENSCPSVASVQVLLWHGKKEKHHHESLGAFTKFPEATSETRSCSAGVPQTWRQRGASASLVQRDGLGKARPNEGQAAVRAPAQVRLGCDVEAHATHATRHTPHAARRTPHAARHTPHATRHTRGCPTPTHDGAHRITIVKS